MTVAGIDPINLLGLKNRKGKKLTQKSIPLLLRRGSERKRKPSDAKKSRNKQPLNIQKIVSSENQTAF
jgi:hypothetical protein